MDVPAKIKHTNGKEVNIHQVGWAGVRLGVIEVSEKKFNFLQKIIH
jgi:hypothetical protein